MFYEMTADCSLPQDLYRQLSSRHTFRGLLRLRTSAEFQVSSAYGHLNVDSKYDHLFHLGVCTPRKSFVCDFEFTSTSGFGSYYDCRPVIQMAFAYTELEGLKSQEGKSWRVVRRLRVATFQAGISSNLPTLYRNVNPTVVLSMLTQQLVQHSLEKGISETRTSLQDWLVHLLGCYHQHIVGFREGGAALDLGFSEVDRLQLLPRYVFALLKHKLLTKDCSPDYRVFLHCLLSGLEPAELARCVYPTLLAFNSLDVGSNDALFLESSSLLDGSIFLLDSLLTIYVYYSQRAQNLELAFPPPQGAAIRAQINQLKSNTPLISPKVVYLVKASRRRGYLLSNCSKTRLSWGSRSQNSKLSSLWS